MSQKKFIKNLLTTASALAVITSAGTAAASTSVTINPAGQTNANHYNNETNAGVAAAFTAGNTIILGGVHDIEILNANLNIAGINLLGYDGRQIKITQNGATIGNIINDTSAAALASARTVTANAALATGGNNNAKISIVFQAGAFSANLTANDIKALSRVDFNNTNGTLKITGAASNNLNFTAAVKSSAGDNGTLELDADNVTLSGGFDAIGNAVNVIKLNAGKTATANTELKFAANIELGAGSTLNIGAGKAITSNAGDIKGTAANNGTLSFAGSSVVGATIGNAGNLLKVELGAGTVELSKAVYKATTTEFKDNAAAIKFSAANTAVESDFKTTINGKGKIIANEDTTIKGIIGENANRLEAINFSADKILTLEKAALDLFTDSVTTSTKDTGELKFKADTVNLYSDIGVSGTPLKLVSLDQSVAGGGGVVTFALKDGHKIYATKFDMAKSVATNNIFVLENNTEVKADIITSKANNGIIRVHGDAKIDGAIGTGAAALDKIEFDTADKTLTATKNILEINNIDFTQHGILNLTENANFVSGGALNINIAADAAGKGAILINQADSGKIISFGDAVGDVTANKSLRLLEAKGGAKIIFTEPAAINKIDIGNQDTEVQLSKAAGVYKFELAHENNKGVLKITDNNIQLKAGTVISTEAARLKQVVVQGDQTVTFEDGINIYTGADGIRNTSAGQATLIFEGTHTVDAGIGLNNSFKAIEIKGKNKIVDFIRDVKLDTGANGTITVYEEAVAIFRGNVEGVSIDGKAALVNGQGSIMFENEAAATINLKIGNTNLIENITLGGADITFKQGARTKNLSFSNDGPTKAIFTTGATDLANTSITSASDNRGHNIQIEENNDLQFNVDVASSERPFGNFILTGDFLTNDKKVNINTSNFYAGVTTTVNQKGIVDFIRNGGADIYGSTVLNLGDETNELKAVNFNQNAKVQNGVYAKDITIAGGKEAFVNVLSSSNGVVLNTGSKITLSDNGSLKANIRANAANDGSVIFNGAATVNNTIGASGQNVDKIQFLANDGDQIVSVGQNLYANAIEFNKAVFRATNNLTFGGAVSFAGTRIDLSNRVLTLTSGASTGTSDIKLDLILDSNAQSVGKFVVDGAGTTLNLNTAQSLQISIRDDSDLPGANGRTFSLFETSNNGQITSIDQNKVLKIASTGNQFTSWTFDSASGVLTQKNNAAEMLLSIVGNDQGVLSKDTNLLGDSANTGDAKKLQSDLGRLTDKAKIKEAIERVSNPTVTATAIRNAVFEATQPVQNRIALLSPNSASGIQTTDAGYSGISAGDDSSKYGVWFTPFFNTSTQKKNGTSAGFKTNSSGGTVGGDMKINDTSIGVAISYFKTDINHKDFKSGDKSKVGSYVFSVYGTQQLTNEWFMQGMITYSSSNVKNTEKRITSTGNQTAKGKFDTTSYGAEALFGYLQSFNGVTVTPLFGLSMSKFNDGGYKETGTSFQNLTITKKDTSRFEGVVGGRIQMTGGYMEGMDLIPEVHGFIRHDFLNKDQKISLKLDGLVNQFSEKSAKNNRTTYNLGFGINAKADIYEYGAGYDLNLGKGSIGHQGTFKVKINL